MRPTELGMVSAQASPDPSWPQRLDEKLSHLSDAYLTPLQGLAAALLVVAATVLLAARVAPLLIRTWPRLGGPADPYTRPTVLAVGLACTGLSAALLTLGLADALSAPTTTWTQAFFVAAVGVLGLAGWLWNQGCAAAVGPGSPPGAWFRSLRQFVLVLVTALAIGLPVIVQLLHGTGTATAAVSLGVLCGLAAILLLGWWLATRLRLAISVRKADGSDDPAAAALVTALLGDLGASPPRGLEVPTGADATELSDALAAIPGAGSLATKLGAFISGLLGATPWRAELAMVEGSCLAVRMSRSGHSVGSTVIRPSDGRDRTGADTPAVDLQRLAAAYLLTTLDAHHGPFPGLVGATTWRSLGLHYIATTDLAGDRTRHSEAVARAAAIDPKSGLAAIAWRHALWRRSSSSEDLDEYLGWLERFHELHANSPALVAVLLRTAYTRTAVALNRSFLPGAPPLPDQYSKARSALHAILQRTAGDDELGWLRAQITAAEACLPPGPKGTFGPPPAEIEVTTPTAAYNLGCWCASSTAPDYAQAAVLIQRAVTLPSLRDAVRDDPQLAVFVTSPEFKAAFLADPRTDFFDLAPVVPYARVLATLSYTAPESLALAVTDPNLIVVLGVSGRSRVTGLAQLCLDLAEDPVLRPLRIEILHELAERRLLTPADLAAQPAESRAALSTTVLEHIDSRCKPRDPAVTAQSLLDWWDASFPLAEE